jgi:multifunctional beta-oxidation protein
MSVLRHPDICAAQSSQDLLKVSKSLSSNPKGPEIDFKGKTVIITGAGAGLGRIYALMFGKMGANVVVNDVSKDGAESVVQEVVKAGGKAVAAPFSAEDGEGIVKLALEKYGSVHVLIANAGILRDKSFQAMSPAEWDAVIAVHLKGTYKCIKAVWPIFQKQKYGRIITTASGVGLYGNFGQANYSTAKSGIIGMTKTAAIEGARYNIKANSIAPSAGTAMTKTIWPQEMVDMFKPDFIAPVVGFLSSDACPVSGSVHEVMAGWAAEVRWERTEGFCFPNDKKLQPEDVLSKWKQITDFSKATHPQTAQEAQEQMFKNFGNVSGSSSESTSKSSGGGEDTEAIKKAKARKGEETEYTFDERDVMLYNLGIGAKASELPLVFEGADGFQVSRDRRQFRPRLRTHLCHL